MRGTLYSQPLIIKNYLLQVIIWITCCPVSSLSIVVYPGQAVAEVIEDSQSTLPDAIWLEKYLKKMAKRITVKIHHEPV